MSIFVKISLIFFFLCQIIFGQNSKITGKILDENGKPVIGANIFLKGTVLGASTDDVGFFTIANVPLGSFTLSISVIGFKEKNIKINIEPGGDLNIGPTKLTSTPLQSQPIVVTASKYEQNVQDVSVSISSINSKEIEYRNTITIDKALQYVPGINMNQGQVNIRGSSGYSRGVGSRVMMLVDGVPFVSGDTQGLNFEALAMNQIKNVEIVKGAGSALYGSSAIGGVINVITKSISDEPRLSFKTYGGLYSTPYYEQWKWSDKNRFLYGAKISYSQKIDKTGFSFAVTKDQDDSFRMQDWKERYNIGGKLEYEFSAFEKLTLSGNYMDQKRGNFLYWKNLENALLPGNPEGEKIHSVRYYLSPKFQKIISPTNYYNINAIWFHNKSDDNISGDGNHSKSDYLYAEFLYNIAYLNHFFTFGFSPTYNKVTSDIFGSRDGYGTAVYLQDEISWSDQIKTTIGARFDNYDIDSLDSDYGINPKIGILYKPFLGSAYRASVGTGFRAPSMAEAFTSIQTSGITVIENHDLKSEKSASFEIGWNQVFSSNIVSDFAVFYNQYWDLIENEFTADYKVRFNNVTKAQILGFETNIQLQPIPGLFNSIGYTFIDPKNLENGEFLKYRPRHLFYAAAKWEYKMFLTGLDYRYISRYDKIDTDLAQVVPNAKERVAAHILDLRISADVRISNLPINFSFQINNLLQYNYIDLIGSIAPIRNYIFTIESQL